MNRLIGFAILTAATLLISQTTSAQTATQTGDPRVKAALEKMSFKYEVDKDGDFKVGMQMQGGRTQLAWIMSKTEKLGNLEIREVISPAYRSTTPISQEVANRLLADNARRKLGAWQTFKNNNSYLAVFATKIAANSSAEDLETSLKVALYSADEMEKTITGKDDF